MRMSISKFRSRMMIHPKAAGSQTITLQCNIDSGVLAKFDASSDSYLDEDVSFTFDDFDMPKEFQEIIGLAA